MKQHVFISLCLGALVSATAPAKAQMPDFQAQQRAAAQAAAKESARLQSAAKDRHVRDMRSAKLQAAGVPRAEADEAAKDEAQFKAALSTANAAKGKKPNTPVKKPTT